MKETTDLLSRLNNTSDEKSLKKYLDDIDGKNIAVRDYYNSFLIKNNMSATDVIKAAGIDKSYGNQILNGTKKNPSIDKLIAIAIALKMNLDETNKLLQLSGQKMLYSKNKRDSIIIYAINKKMSVMDTNYELARYGEKELQ